MRSPFAPIVLPVVALLAALARWKMQGSGNLYTAVDKRFYIPDPDLGWQVSPRHPIWLGLEICAIIAAVAVGLAVAAWIIRRREAKRGEPARILRGASWLVALVPLVVPIAAFASGGAPAHGVDTLPASTVAGIEAGIVGVINAPAGRYVVVEHAGTAITAKMSAGRETFDARFGGGIRGGWQGNPHDLTQPIGGEVSVDTASVDTGIAERSKHARESYLQADKHPRISVAIDRVIAASQSGPDTATFRAHGTLGLMGKTHSIEITGTIKRPDAAALARLGLSGEILLVQADFAVVIKETALASDAGDFDSDRIPIHVSLVLRHTSG
ncbi:MAG: YceI family protein [Myxococcales bacterium]|nr:YceI family protein [Myxococcales bacterium]